MLFTSCGVSGPIILTLSSLINRVGKVKDMTLTIDLKPAMTIEELDRRILSDFNKNLNKHFKNGLDELLPKSLIPYIIKVVDIPPEKPLNSVTKDDRLKLAGTLKALRFGVESLGGINEAIVTSGGVNVSEINPKTMESKLVPGLYFAGEVLDADALTGGFNIQIADRNGLYEKNGLEATDILISTTEDLTASYPAKAIRESGIVRAPLFSMREPAIDGALSKCIRLMVRVANYGERVEPRHVYLHEAAKLRPDLVKNQ